MRFVLAAAVLLLTALPPTAAHADPAIGPAAVRVIDGAQQTVGTVVGADADGHFSVAFSIPGLSGGLGVPGAPAGVVLTLDNATGTLSGNRAALLFGEPGCAGQRFLAATTQREAPTFVGSPGSTLYVGKVVRVVSFLQPRHIKSRMRVSGKCIDVDDVVNTMPVWVQVDLLSVYTPPFSVEFTAPTP